MKIDLEPVSKPEKCGNSYVFKQRKNHSKSVKNRQRDKICGNSHKFPLRF
ncbi:hypothetical protein LEP1GSC062_2269 [Leptospira alexanderi serovar Manhao 3 str. L 60]|uniref:Uncharacterized protein n=1 Tax=Leptospira alexanderi serovar Manhao 3 str. L 60 TaxID=1049759 RepID=V6I3M6_9LEPT|nr:hypothetical protein LEP1GSC062_2269 [Leptospira alexanderi serovar Manhao 3 str. L 60]